MTGDIVRRIGVAAGAVRGARDGERRRREIRDARIAAVIADLRKALNDGRVIGDVFEQHRATMTDEEIDNFFCGLLDSTDQVLSVAARKMTTAFTGTAATNPGCGSPRR